MEYFLTLKMDSDEIDHVKIMAPVNEILSYQLVDAMGNILRGGTFRGEITFDTRPMPWGNYYVKLYRRTLLLTQPIIKVNR